MSVGGALHADLAYGVAHACAAGEQVSGDAWVAVADDEQVLLAAIDGLGHGAAAREAAELRRRDDPRPRRRAAAVAGDRMPRRARRHARRGVDDRPHRAAPAAG